MRNRTSTPTCSKCRAWQRSRQPCFITANSYRAPLPSTWPPTSSVAGRSNQPLPGHRSGGVVGTGRLRDLDFGLGRVIGVVHHPVELPALAAITPHVQVLAFLDVRAAP